MGHDEKSPVRRPKRREHRRHHAESVDVETRIDFVENDELRMQETELQKFDPTFFPSRKSDVQFAVEKRFGNAESRRFLLNQALSNERGKRLGRGVVAANFRIDDRTEVFRKFDPLDFRNVLEGEEYPLGAPVFRRKDGNRFAVEEHFALRHRVFRMSGYREGQGRFSRTVFPKKVAYGSRRQFETHGIENSFPFGFDAQVLNAEHEKNK